MPWDLKTAWLNNCSVKKASAECFTMIYNTKLKFAGLLMDNGNRNDFGCQVFRKR